MSSELAYPRLPHQDFRRFATLFFKKEFQGLDARAIMDLFPEFASFETITIQGHLQDLKRALPLAAGLHRLQAQLDNLQELVDKFNDDVGYIFAGVIPPAEDDNHHGYFSFLETEIEIETETEATDDGSDFSPNHDASGKNSIDSGWICIDSVSYEED